MTTLNAEQQGNENTDREIWREREGDFYADSIHVTKDGRVGIDCGGHVFVKPVREWHRLAALATALRPEQEGVTVPTEEMVYRGAVTLAGSPLIDTPKLDEVCWRGLARAVYEAMRALEPKCSPPAQAGWISVTERLPDFDPDVSVLACYASGSRDVLAANYVRMLTEAARSDDDDCYVTHWQPLPAPPSTPTQGERE